MIIDKQNLEINGAKTYFLSLTGTSQLIFENFVGGIK